MRLVVVREGPSAEVLRGVSLVLAESDAGTPLAVAVDAGGGRLTAAAATDPDFAALLEALGLGRAPIVEFAEGPTAGSP